MAIVLEDRVAAFLKKAGLSVQPCKTLFLFLSIIFSALFLNMPLYGTGISSASAQSYRTKLYRSPKQISYNRARQRKHRRAGRSRRVQIVRKPKKSFLSGLFGDKSKKRRARKTPSLFDNFSLPKLLQKSPARLNADYQRRMRAGAQRRHGPRIISYGDGSRGWSFDDAPASSRSGGRYRTMCVRLCDGFYYPVSFKTGSSNLQRDEARCNSGCYDAPTKLFYYSNPGGSIEDMRALDGTSYKELANAFRYRKEFVADCRCKAEPWSRQARAQHESWAETKKQAQLTQLSHKE